MGPRQRLDQLQGRANALLAKAEWTLADVREMCVIVYQAIMDGVAVRLFLEEDFLGKITKQLMSGKAGFLPGMATFDLEYSNLPKQRCEFAGGPYDGKSYDMSDAQRKVKVILLQDLDGDNEPEMYLWDGHRFVYQGKPVVTKAAA